MNKKYFDIILEDDDTPTGGVSFLGETVHDFLMECELDPNISLEEFNKILVACGIRPIKGEIKMDNDTVHKIVSLTDEKNYLRNILEAAEETGEDLEKLIQDRIEAIYEQLEELEGGD